MHISKGAFYKIFPSIMTQVTYIYELNNLLHIVLCVSQTLPVHLHPLDHFLLVEGGGQEGGGQVGKLAGWLASWLACWVAGWLAG